MKVVLLGDISLECTELFQELVSFSRMEKSVLHSNGKRLQRTRLQRRPSTARDKMQHWTNYAHSLSSSSHEVTR